MTIFLAANTSIGKKGNIGYRLASICDVIIKNHSGIVFARANYTSNSSIHSFRALELIGQSLNFLRLYVFAFSHRLYDAFIFELVAFIYYYFHPRKNLISIAILCEYMPRFASYLRAKGIHVILDVPISPEAHKLMPENTICSIICPYDSIIDRLETISLHECDKIIAPSIYTQNQISKISKSPKIFSTCYKNIPSINPIQSVDQRVQELQLLKVNFIFVGNLSRRKRC